MCRILARQLRHAHQSQKERQRKALKALYLQRLVSPRCMVCCDVTSLFQVTKPPVSSSPSFFGDQLAKSYNPTSNTGGARTPLNTLPNTGTAVNSPMENGGESYDAQAVQTAAGTRVRNQPVRDGRKASSINRKSGVCCIIC